MPGAALEEIVEALGAPLLDVWVPPSDWRAPLCDVVIHDTAEAFAAGPGDLLLAVGADAQNARSVLRPAARAGVAAVVVRSNPRLREELSAAARESGVGLLALAPEVGWARFTGQVRGQLSATGADLDTDLSDAADLVSFANALCTAVGGSVMIFNPRQEVLAASRLTPTDDAMRRQAVLDQRGPAWYRNRLRERGVYWRLWQTEEVVDVDAIPEHGVGRRLAIAIRSGDEILGSIWVAERDTPLAADAAETLSRAAPAAGRHLRRPRSPSPSRFLEGVGRRLLSGTADAGTAAAAGWLDADPAHPAMALTCVLADGQRGSERRLGELLSLGLATLGGVVVPVSSRGRIDLLVCDLPPGTDGARLEAAARDIAVRAGRTLNRAVLCAVGPVVATLEDVSRSHQEADLVLRVLLADGGPGTRVATPADVRARADLLALTDLMAAGDRFGRGPVPDLIAYDREHRTSYAASLAAYLDAFGDVITAARSLCVHPNTLRYRIRRIPELSGLDLADPDARLLAALQLRTARANGGLDRATKTAHKAQTSA